MVFLGDLEDTPIMKVTMCGSWGQTIRGQPQKVPAVLSSEEGRGRDVGCGDCPISTVA